MLEHVARGDTVSEIAARLHLSEGTVRNYLSAAATKLGAANRHEAVHRARAQEPAASWAEIGRAAGITRQSAHEKWGSAQS